MNLQTTNNHLERSRTITLCLRLVPCTQLWLSPEVYQRCAHSFKPTARPRARPKKACHDCQSPPSCAMSQTDLTPPCLQPFVRTIRGAITSSLCPFSAYTDIIWRSAPRAKDHSCTPVHPLKQCKSSVGSSSVS